LPSIANQHGVLISSNLWLSDLQIEDGIITSYILCKKGEPFFLHTKGREFWISDKRPVLFLCVIFTKSPLFLILLCVTESFDITNRKGRWNICVSHTNRRFNVERLVSKARRVDVSIEDTLPARWLDYGYGCDCHRRVPVCYSNKSESSKLSILIFHPCGVNH